MLLTTITGLFTFALVSYDLAVGTSTRSIALSLDPTSPYSPHPTSDGPVLAVRFRGNEGGRSDDHVEDGPSLEQLGSLMQVCPTDSPILCVTVARIYGNLPMISLK